MSARSCVSSRSLDHDHVVLPPIVTSDKDRQFLYGLNLHIHNELDSIDGSIPEQRYVVHKDAFNKIIDYVGSYKPLLTAIKAEYEDCIDTIERGQREAFYLTGKLNALATEPSTVHNYRKRADDLDHKLSVISEDNERLRQELNQIRALRLEKEQQRETDKPPPREVKRDSRHIPGLTLQQSTDTKVLAKEFEKLERQLKELNISYKTRYSPIDIRDTLKDQLSQKVTLRDQLQEQTAILKQKRQKLKVAVEAAHAYIKIQPPHQTIGEAVVNALTRSSSQITDKVAGEEIVHQRTTPSNSFEDDDPTKEKEAELMLEYIEKFNELLEDKRYEEAATHAANSPKGILRTPETLHRFMDLRDNMTSTGRSPYLAFCDWLMATVPAYPTKPSDYLSLECVKCALEENRLDLITHWLSQDRLTLTQLLGDMIVDFCDVRPHLTKQCMSLAQRVYVGVQAHVPAALCMTRQGRLAQAIEYAQKMRMSREDCAAVLAAQPSDYLALGLYETRIGNTRLMPMGQIAHTLITVNLPQMAVDYIWTVHQQGANDPVHNASPLRNSVFEDEVTTLEQWHHLVEVCQNHGYHDSGLDILAAATVITSVRSAARCVEEMEREKEEERRRQEEERLLQEEARGRKEKKKKRRRQANREALDARAEADSDDNEITVAMTTIPVVTVAIGDENDTT